MMLSIFLFIYLPYISSLEKYLSASFVHFLTVYFVVVFFLLSIKPSFYILLIEINPLPDVWFANIFSRPVAPLFFLLSGFSLGKFRKSWWGPIYFVFLLWFMLLMSSLKLFCLALDCDDFILSLFGPTNFLVLNI